MSFRIDDILKCEEKKKTEDADKGPRRVWESNILQETLMQYNEYPSYCQDRKFFTGFDFYSPFGAFDHYNKVALSKYTSMANRMWPTMYGGGIPSILPFSYQHYIKRKGGQVRFTATQTDALERRFRTHKYLSPEDRRVLADSLKLSDRQVKTWFQNRRAKWRRSNSVSSNGDRIQDCDSETETEICEDEEKPMKN